MNVTETLKIIAAAHDKANKITMSCENEQHLEAAIAYIKNLKKMCANLKLDTGAHEIAYIKHVEQSIDSTLTLKRKSIT